MTQTPREQLSDGEVVRSEVTVPAERSLAYETFTSQLGSWWPREYQLSEDAQEVVLEPRVGGRWYERTSDGTEVDWGQVVGVSPPYGITMTWAIDASWQPNPAAASELEVAFDEVRDGTRVVVRHKHLQRAGEGWEQLRDQVSGEGGWDFLLRRYAEAAGGGG